MNFFKMPKEIVKIHEEEAKKDKQCNNQTKGNKTPHRKLKIEQHEPHKKSGCYLRLISF